MITEKELLELLNDGVECLSSRRHIDYETELEVRRLIENNEIEVIYKCEHGTFGGKTHCVKCNPELMKKEF